MGDDTSSPWADGGAGDAGAGDAEAGDAGARGAEGVTASGATDAGADTDDTSGPDSGETPPASDDGPDDRQVVVPMRLYKTVTVFSTLLAVAGILVGFVLLDRGTQRATAGPEEVSLPIVALGLAFIVGGSAVYAFSTRFRAEGMGKPKDESGEQSDNG